ncbi:centrosomal protein of 55 kDa [Eublepharis macularius]|uniref:Centrosomal protein of 55 kDa n=1 Tax=Eublepharis macularius TaxID=481883 RepID=A0AA97JLW0_EUBMA|nr:centrosomal protein of 55 kDa [Eublepharis macularius]XP_054839399.1 centrosomal protein of 55 kDa [Eublepharis macularius]
MTSKATSETSVSKWKLKSGDSKSETELQIYKKENAALKKSLEEMIKGKSKMTPEERKRLLEKILALEMENEKYHIILGGKDKEIQHLKDELKKRSKTGELTSLHSRLEETTKEVAKKEQQLTSLLREMDRLKNELAPKCSELENRDRTVQVSQETVAVFSGSQRSVNEVEIQLKDALEKNHQWLIYDQQREAYVQGLLARIFELEQQFKTIIQQEVKETQTEEEQQINYDQLLVATRHDLEIERLAVAQLHSELNAFKRKHDETQREMMHLNVLKSEHQTNMQTLQDENHFKEEIIQRLTHESQLTREKLEEERKRTEALVSQVELLHKSLLKQQEEHSRIAALEQQVQACTSDFENEKVDRQNLQHQLHKLLKELRKAREQITRLEPAKLPEHACIEVLHNFQTAFEDKLVIQDECSSPKRSNLLDESFLECPKCKALYPTSQHRELLAHIDFCAD